MAETLKEFISRRRKELDAAESDLRRQLAEIEGERRSLQLAEDAAEKGFKVKRIISREGHKRRIKPNTIMADVLEILRRNEGGMIALDILAELNKCRDYPLLRTSLSPQLSRLKDAGYIELIGSTWKIRKSESDLLSKEDDLGRKDEEDLT